MLSDNPCYRPEKRKHVAHPRLDSFKNRKPRKNILKYVGSATWIAAIFAAITVTPMLIINHQVNADQASETAAGETPAEKVSLTEELDLPIIYDDPAVPEPKPQEYASTPSVVEPETPTDPNSSDNASDSSNDEAEAESSALSNDGDAQVTETVSESDSAEENAYVQEYVAGDGSGGGRLTKAGGVNYFNGNRETWYSQRVLPGYGLNIPGRHVDPSDGTVRDGDGYICVASDNYPKGTLIETSLGMGKVYDAVGGDPTGNTVDIYVDW